MCIAAASLAACAGIFGFDHLEESGAGGPEAGVEGSAPDAGDAGDAQQTADVCVPNDAAACTEFGFPGPPATGSATELPAMLFALSLFDLGLPEDGGFSAPMSGFNLDRTCTDKPAQSSCVPAKGTTASRLADKDGSIDNVGEDLILVLATGSIFSPKGINDLLQNGKFGGVINVDKYNGTLNDTQVTVSMVPTIGLDTGGKPNFTETDRWRPDGLFYSGNDQSIFVTPDAYVTDGVLVAKLPEITFRLPVAPESPFLVLHLYDVKLSATVVIGDGGTYRLTDGVFAGRWSAKEMVGTIGGLRASSIADAGICNASGIFGLVRNTICPSRDIAERESDDEGACKPQRPPCNAISAGARFDTYRVNTTGVTVPADFDSGVVPVVCPPGYDDCDRDF
jgi:hypothetical protein